MIAVSNAVGPSEREVCLRSLAPTAFGVSPVISRYDASVAAARQSDSSAVLFEDRSEHILQLSAGAICRVEFNDFGIACPYRLINQVFLHHSDLNKLGAE